ncbi:olfactory receptor 10A2-like [Emys orbicularis]|uniref:olfactory receptor 10A2-like n=1 Tax=Emys orbicularis TaxID=82168 RepID=UPI0031FC8531
MMNLNRTVVTEFLLLGFSTSPERQVLLFVALLAIYLVTVVGNLLIILVTLVDPTLHTSMYFFLSNLSALEVGYTSVTVPKMLVSLISGDKRISFAGCAMQMCFFLCFGSTESSFLATMAYDRYVAICNPLCYPMIMNKKVCVLLAATSWTIGIPAQVVQTGLVFTLPFCSSKEINHFFCDPAPLLLLACADTSMNETMSMANQTTVTEFILLGLFSDPQLQTFLFLVFLVIYLTTLGGNVAIMLVRRADPHLDTPMYFFLSHLSFSDICFSSVMVPKMLETLLSERKTISVSCCFAQMFFLLLSGCSEVFFLSAMAYDRYAAICDLLHYIRTMSKHVCSQLVAGA